MVPPRIAIAGGGPAALTLGALLHRQHIPFTILERRPSPTPADLAQPSSPLDLHEESGLAAIRACGLWDAFLPLTTDCEESLIVADGATGAVLHADDGGASRRPEAARLAITDLILGVVPHGAVRWETKIVAARRDAGSEATTLQLQSGGTVTEETFDFVVGADGAWSRIRLLLTPAVPQVTNLSYVTLAIKDITTRFPELAARIGKGTYSAFARRHMLSTQRGVADSALVSFFVNDVDVGAAHTAKLNGMGLEELKVALLGEEGLFGSFAEEVREVGEAAFADAVRDKGGESKVEVRPLVMLPPGLTWETVPGVTLIGDAAHVMLPTAGEGVNCAMRDALDLSAIIARAWKEAASDGQRMRAVLGPLVREFEQEMQARAAEFSREAMDNAEMMFGEEGAKGMAAFMAEALAGGGDAAGKAGEVVGVADQ